MLRSAEGSGGGAVELAQIVPEVKELVGPLDAPATLDPETARLRLFEAVGGLVFTLRSHRPLVVVLDDLQWADVPSLQLLGFLGSRLREVPLLVVGTFRPAEVDPGHPLTDTLATLARHQVTAHLELDGLAACEVGLLLAATTGAPAAAEVVQTVVARTDGNPFFVAELARLLVSEHDLRPDTVAKAGAGGCARRAAPPPGKAPRADDRLAVPRRPRRSRLRRRRGANGRGPRRRAHARAGGGGNDERARSGARRSGGALPIQPRPGARNGDRRPHRCPPRPPPRPLGRRPGGEARG
ncbi:MAG: AAA family ATPase [Acidimicrobiales bacterium]